VAKFRSKLAEETRFTSSSKQPAISPARFSAAGKTSQNSAESSSNKITADETKSNEELTAEQTKGPRWRRDKMTTPQQQPPPTKLSPAVSETSLSSSSTTKTYQQQQKPTTLKTAEREKPREIMTKSRLEKIPESPKNRTPSLVADQPTVTKKVSF
jgi:hypothetical protein